MFYTLYVIVLVILAIIALIGMLSHTLYRSYSPLVEPAPDAFPLHYRSPAIEQARVTHFDTLGNVIAFSSHDLLTERLRILDSYQENGTFSEKKVNFFREAALLEASGAIRSMAEVVYGPAGDLGDWNVELLRAMVRTPQSITSAIPIIEDEPYVKDEYEEIAGETLQVEHLA